MDFIRWYRNIMESARQEPPAAVWEEVQNQLDIEEVWMNLEKELPVSRTREKTLFFLAMAASLLVLIAVGTLFLAGPAGHDAGQFTAGNHRNHDVFSKHSGNNDGFQSLLSAVSEFPVSTRGQQPATSFSPEGNGRGTSEEFPAYSPGVPGINALIGQETDRNSLIAGIAGNDAEQVNRASSSLIKKPALSGYYAGVTGHLANTWLLNNKTLQGLKSDDLTSSLPSFGYSIGIIAGKSVNSSLDLQAEAYFLSLSRQGYNEYLHGQYINNLMQFSYSRIAVSAKWYFINKNDHNKHSLLLGAYTGLLKNALQDLGGESVSLNDQYRTADFGIIAGYEYLHPIGNHLSVGTGFQTKLGLNNIFAGNEIVPGYLNNTRNASINFMISLRYDLK